MISFLLPLVSVLSFQSPALAAEGFSGSDAWGRKCSLSIEDSRGGTELTFHTSKYTFTEVPLKATADGYTFDALTIDRGADTFSPPIGAPITIGSIGLVTVKGSVTLDADKKPQAVKMSAAGGLANWWHANYDCAKAK